MSDPSSDEPGRDDAARDPAAGRDLDAAWARLVADYQRPVTDPDAPRRWPEAEDLGPDRPAETPADSPAGTGAPPAPDPGTGRWVPPPPPPLPRPTGATGVAWVALATGPLLLFVATVVGWRLPTLLTAGCIIGFVGGLVFLIAQMDDRRADGWDDGAQV